jgi:hypothetical protein
VDTFSPASVTNAEKSTTGFGAAIFKYLQRGNNDGKSIE